jgi:hypothetical protein
LRRVREVTSSPRCWAPFFPRPRIPPGRGCNVEAVVFTGATRNSLVVLPLALACPTLTFDAIVVVTQSFVEVVGMEIYV